MVVYAEVTDAIDALSGSLRRSELLDDERSRLLPAAIAARGLTGLERCDQPLGQRRAGIEEGAAHRGKHVSAREHVALHREAVSNEMPRPLAAVTPCERSCSTVGGNRSQLAEFPIIVRIECAFERHGRINLCCERT